MSDLALLATTPDTTRLPDGGAAAVSPETSLKTSREATGPATGSFASVLGKQVQPAEQQRAVTSQSPSQVNEVSATAATANGEPNPASGNPLPSLPVDESLPHQDASSEADAALLAAMTQAAPSVAPSVASSTSALPQPGGDPEPMLQTVLSQRLAAQMAAENGVLPGQAQRQVAAAANLAMQNPDGTPAPAKQQAVVPAMDFKFTAAESAPANPSTTLPTLPNTPLSASIERALRRAINTAGNDGATTTAVQRQATSLGMSGQGSGLNNAAPTTLHAIDSAMRADVLNRAIVASAQDGVNVDSRVSTNNTFSNTMAANGVSSVDDVSGAVPGLQRLNSIGVGYSPTLSVSTPVGQPGWAHDMAQRVTWLAGSELREAQLQLHPRNLGLVDVRIVYGHDQQLNVSFSAANPLARDALDAALPRLRDMFEQQGLNLAGADISHESFAEREQGNDTGDKPVAFDGAVAEHTADELKIPMTAPLQMQGEGMLNLYA